MEHTETRPQTASAEVGFAAYGVTGSLSASTPDLLGAARSLLPPGWKSCESPSADGRFAILERDDGYEVSLNGESKHRHGDRELALGLLDAQIRAYVAFHAPDAVFVHAGVVGHGGGAIVIPAPTFSGKTTLVAALVRAGATYYSDEFAVIDAQGRVRPYPKPLSIRDGTSPGADRSAESLGGTVGTAALPVALVAVTSYRPGARWAPESHSAGDGALALLANTVPARDRPREALAAVSRASASALVLEGERGEADETAQDLLSR
jgi:hypothetical protein